MKENDINNLNLLQNENKSDVLDLTKGNATFFNFAANNDNGNKKDCEKIDNAKKTLDSIYHVYEQVNQLEENKKHEVNSENNQIVDNSTGRIVMPGTDYHGDRRSFQAGVISELVTWKKDKISVMDVIDGEILFTGTINEIKENISKIKNQLDVKNKDHQEKIKDKVKQIITQGMTAYLQKKLACDSCNGEVVQDKTFKITITESDNKKIFKNQNTESNVIEFDIETVVDILVDIKTDDQQKYGKLMICFNELESYNTLTDESQGIIVNFFKQLFSISKQQKVVLVHDFEFNKNFDPEKQSVVLLGDYIDRGNGSCEILCMISNIQKRISESEDERFKNNKDCFVAISGNHESGVCSVKDTISPVWNDKNDTYANDLAKKMMADGWLVSGHIIASNIDDTFFSFSHTYIIKIDCYFIMRQIFQLEDLLKNIENEDWLNDENNKNEFVRSIRQTFENKMNNYGKKILQLLAKRYESVKNSNKYVGVLQKVNDNSLSIREKLKEYQVAIFKEKEVVTAGNQFYNNLRNIFSDKNFFELRYLAMDTLVYPIAASTDKKLDLCFDSIFYGEIHLSSILRDSRLAFSDFFRDGPDCLKSFLKIVYKERAGYIPNCLNWQRFADIPKSMIIPNNKQFIGHEPLNYQKHKLVVFYSQIIEIDISQSIGFSSNYATMVSYINKIFIHTIDIKKSYTFTYKAESINHIKPKVSEYNRYLDIFHNEDLKYKYKGTLLKLNSKTSSKKWVSIILELLLVCIGLLLILFTHMQVFGIILLIIGTIGFFVSMFFHDKVANWICNLCFRCCLRNVSQIQKEKERENFNLETNDKFPQTLGCSQQEQSY